MTESKLQKRTSPFRYGVGMFGTSIPINMFKSFALTFYVDMLGLDAKKYSIIIAIYTVVDAIDNPIYGYLSDRTRTKWGRRRPWLVLGTPLLILCFILFYNVPKAIVDEKNMLFIYMLLMYILTGTLDSLMNASYGALFPELFRTDAERAKTNAIRQTFQLFAMAISIALTPMITERIGYQITSIVYGVVALAVVLYCTFGCHENEEYYINEEKPKLLSTVVDLAKNKKFWIYGFAGAFYSASFSLVSQAIPLYVKYTLKLDGNMTTVMLGIVLGVAVLGIAFWSAVIKKIQIIKIWRIGFCVMALGLVPLYFSNSFSVSLSIACVVGFGIASCLVSMDCIGAKIMDDDYQKHGIKREGMISSLSGVMNRLNGFYISFAITMVSDMFGYVSGDEPGENPAVAAKFLLCVFPAIAMALAALFSFFLKFEDNKEEPDKIKAEVTE